MKECLRCGESVTETTCTNMMNYNDIDVSWTCVECGYSWTLSGTIHTWWITKNPPIGTLLIAAGEEI